MTLFDVIGACFGVGLLITVIAIAVLREKERQEREQRGGERVRERR